MKKLKILGNILFYMVITILIFIILVTVNAKRKGMIPQVFGYKVLEILTGSMEPTIEQGSLILIKETPKEEIENGDVITYRYEGTNNIVTHRVVNILNSGDTFITKGDANNADDPEIKYDEIEGVVKGSVPKVGKIIGALSKNIIFIVVGIISLITVISLLDIFNKDKIKSEKK